MTLNKFQVVAIATQADEDIRDPTEELAWSDEEATKGKLAVKVTSLLNVKVTSVLTWKRK